MQTLERSFRAAQLAEVTLDFGDFDAGFKVGDGLVVDIVKMVGEADRFGAAGSAQRGGDFAAQDFGPIAQLPLERFALLDGQRHTSTGILLWVRTFAVSLPSSSADSPRLPCEAMTMRSHLFERAVPMIALQG
jgi:hypothetical protein